MRRISCGEASSASHPARAVPPQRYSVRGRSPEKPLVSWAVTEEALRNGHWYCRAWLLFFTLLLFCLKCC